MGKISHVVCVDTTRAVGMAADELKPQGQIRLRGILCTPLVRIWFWLAVLVAVSGSAAAQSSKDAGSQQPPIMDRQKEIALAISACPSSLASQAAVYVLGESGYV